MSSTIISDPTIPTPHEEIYQQILDHAAGYTNSNIKVFVDSTNRAVEVIDLISGCTSKDSEEEVGRQLHNDAQDMLDAISGGLFRRIVENDFDLEEAIRTSSTKRGEVDREIKLKVKPISETNPIRPEKSIEDLEAEIEFQDFLASITKDKCVFPVNQDADVKPVTRGRRKGIVEEVQDDDDDDYADKRKEIQQIHDKKYLHEYKEFKKKSHDRDLAKIRLSELEEQLERSTVLEFVLTAYNDAKRKMAIKIKEAVKAYPAIKQRLSNTAILKFTKLEITNPLELNHLPGLLQLLSDNYNKKTLVTLTNSIIEVLNHALTEEETRYNPVKAVNDAEKMHSIWDKKNLWNHLTPDTFFTSMLIRSLHPRVAVE